MVCHGIFVGRGRESGATLCASWRWYGGGAGEEKRNAPMAIDTHATMLCGQGARPGEGADLVATVSMAISTNCWW